MDTIYWIIFILAIAAPISLLVFGHGFDAIINIIISAGPSMALHENYPSLGKGYIIAAVIIPMYLHFYMCYRGYRITKILDSEISDKL